MIESSFIENLKQPCCPYCGSLMHENHSKMWTGKSYKFLSIEFRCFNSNKFAHQMVIRARTIEEWNNHLKKLKFVIQTNQQRS